MKKDTFIRNKPCAKCGKSVFYMNQRCKNCIANEAVERSARKGNLSERIAMRKVIYEDADVIPSSHIVMSNWP